MRRVRAGHAEAAGRGWEERTGPSHPTAATGERRRKRTSPQTNDVTPRFVRMESPLQCTSARKADRVCDVAARRVERGGLQLFRCSRRSRWCSVLLFCVRQCSVYVVVCFLCRCAVVSAADRVSCDQSIASRCATIECRTPTQSRMKAARAHTDECTNAAAPIVDTSRRCAPCKSGNEAQRGRSSTIVRAAAAAAAS